MRLSFLFIAVLFLFSCKKDTVDPITPQIDAKGKVKTIVKYGYSAEEKWGEITEGVITSKESYTYNESGFETEFLLYYSNGQLEAKEVSIYNSSNKILEINVSDTDGKIYISVKYQYDNNGKLINWKAYYNGDMDSDVNCITDANGRVIKETGISYGKYHNQTYKYDSKGNKIEENSYYEGDVLINTTKFEYNSYDKIIKESEYDDGITLTHEISYSYDSKGNVTDIIETYTNSISRATKYIYDEFDKVDNWIKRRNYKDNKITGITKRVITYY